MVQLTKIKQSLLGIFCIDWGGSLEDMKGTSTYCKT